ncbi:MAG: extracellular solute-binding protein [Actinobacteria bacterium]|nr:extracellular solute-binding protein [Actinomycetota bacterium]
MIISAVLIVIIMSSLQACDLFKRNETVETLPQSTDQGTQVEPEDQASLAENIEIVIWDRIDPKEQLELMESLQIFMEENSNIKINTRHFRSDEELEDQFKAASLAGSGADIVFANLEITAELAESKVIKQLPDEMIYSSTFDCLTEIAVFENKPYAVPFRAFDFLLLYYNKDLVESVPVNFNELVQYCIQVNNPDENIWGFLFNIYEPEWVIPLTGGYQDWVYDYNSGSISLESDAMIKTLEMLLNIYNEQKVVPYNFSYEEINNAFINGSAHMIVNGNWAAGEYMDLGINFGVSKIPVVIDGFRNPTPMAEGIGFMFNTNSYGRQYEAAVKLVDFLMSEETQLSWTSKTDTLPALESMEDAARIKNNEILYNEMQQLKIARGKIPADILMVISDAINLNLESIMAQNISVEEAVKKMQEDAIKLKTGSKNLNQETAQDQAVESFSDSE